MSILNSNAWYLQVMTVDGQKECVHCAMAAAAQQTVTDQPQPQVSYSCPTLL